MSLETGICVSFLSGSISVGHPKPVLGGEILVGGTPSIGQGILPPASSNFPPVNQRQ